MLRGMEGGRTGDLLSERRFSDGLVPPASTCVIIPADLLFAIPSTLLARNVASE